VEAPKDSPEVQARFDANLALPDIIAHQIVRTTGHRGHLEDLIAYGRMGLLDAARRYDPSRGVPFRAFANYRVRGAIVDGMRILCPLARRTHQRLRGLELAAQVAEGGLEDAFAPSPPGAGSERADEALAEHLAAVATAVAVGLLAETVRAGNDGLTTIDPGGTPEQQLFAVEQMRQVRAAITELPERERELVQRHYLQGERFDVVAEGLGLSKSWASRLHTRALKALAERLAPRPKPGADQTGT